MIVNISILEVICIIALHSLLTLKFLAGIKKKKKKTSEPEFSFLLVVQVALKRVVSLTNITSIE